MTNLSFSFSHVSDQALLVEVKRRAHCERECTVSLIASLMELDVRKLYLGEGCSSLFTYCTQVLHLSEHAAYGRIEAARAARRFPRILEMVADGSLNLTTVGLLSPHLTTDNHHQLLDQACRKRKREVEQLVATLRPQPAAPAIVRKLPVRRAPSATTASTSEAPLNSEATPAPVEHHATAAPLRPRTQVKPLAPELYKVQFTVNRETHDKLRRVPELMRHQVPNGDPTAIFDTALTLLLEQLERRKLALAERPRRARQADARSRHVPANVRRDVWARDGGRCAFVGTQGRCCETDFLELHHVVPYAAGGLTTVENLELRCRAHNAYEAAEYFGRELPLLREERAAFG